VNRWQKISTVATFEFLAAVKRPGYLIATFGMPVFMAAYGAVVAIPAYYAQVHLPERVVYGIVDEAGVLGLTADVTGASGPQLPDEMRRSLEAAGQSQALNRAIPTSNLVFRPFARDHEARTALAQRTIKGYFVVPPDYLAKGGVDIFIPDSFSFSSFDSRDAFEDLIRERLVSTRLDADTSARIMKPIQRTQRFAVTRSGEIRDGGPAASVIRLAVPLVFMVLFLLSVLMTSGYLMQGTATEKENKVVEVLLASANPDEILAGKLLGLGGAGLLQIAVWLLMALTTTLGIVPLLMSSRIDVPWLALGVAIPFFIVSFLFFGGLMLGTGSLGTNMREAQQLSMVWSLTAALPLMLIVILLREPNGPVARVLSWLPLTSGQVIVLRTSTDAASIHWWEIVGPFVVLVAATWIGIRIGARLFRIGLLSSGTRPGVREIIRQARLGA
jgi:ABC-2 type transport system permease protein